MTLTLTVDLTLLLPVGMSVSQAPFVISLLGHWEEPTVQEQEKHDTVHKLQVLLTLSHIQALSEASATDDF